MKITRSLILTLLTVGTLWSATPAKAATTFLMSDITTWIGPAAGPGISQAAVVIDWNDGQSSLAWGYRWDSAQPLTGSGLFEALMGAEARLGAVLGISGSPYGIRDITWNGSDRVAPPLYNWRYFLNSTQLIPGGSSFSAPLGSPFDGAGPGDWFSPASYMQTVPVVDGSWNGFRAFSSAELTHTPPSFPINAPPVPEPSSMWLLGSLVLLRRQRG